MHLKWVGLPNSAVTRLVLNAHICLKIVMTKSMYFFFLQEIYRNFNSNPYQQDHKFLIINEREAPTRLRGLNGSKGSSRNNDEVSCEGTQGNRDHGELRGTRSYRDGDIPGAGG